MDHLHLTQELLRAAFEDRSQLWRITPTVLAHLLSLCPVCRKEIEAWDREVAARSPRPAGMASLLRPSLWTDGQGAGDEDEGRAAAQVQVLLELPPEDRLGFLRERGRSFRGAALARNLLEEARAHLPASPGESGKLAELAELVLEPVGGSAPDLDAQLRTRAKAYQANALRARGDLAGADALFSEARASVQGDAGALERLTLAELDRFEGSLRRAQRRFGEARQLLERSVLTYLMDGLATEAIRTQLTLGSVLWAQGDIRGELEVLQKALNTLEPEAEPRLCLMVHHNLADSLCDLGRHEEARAELECHQDLYLRFPDAWTQLRLAWVEGKIARGLGEQREAESFLRAARYGFLKGEQAYDAALVSLDLALLYLDQGRAAEIARLAEEVLPVFRSLGIHRETLAAWMLLVEAVHQDRLTATLLQELAAYLRQARQDPSHRFAPSLEG